MIIEPYKSVGNLLFSDSRETIRQKIHQQYKVGVKEFDEMKEYYDYFIEKEFFVYYDAADKILAFEFFGSSPIFDDAYLLNSKFKELLDKFMKDDKDLIFYGSTLIVSNKFGIAIGAPDYVDNPNCFAESIVVFTSGYYD